MNAGAYVTGSQLARLGEFYAKAIHDNFGDDFDVLFGPAYKGIPLATACTIAYSKLYGKEIKYIYTNTETHIPLQIEADTNLHLIDQDSRTVKVLGLINY